MDKGIIHFHSEYSYDGLMSIKTIADYVENNDLKFVMLTDHDTIVGSLHLQEELKARGLSVEVPISAEYRTDHGDVIGAYLESEIIEKDLLKFCAEVKRQGGISMLPHPYDSHQNPEFIVSLVDVVETFNSRSSVSNNYKSNMLSIVSNKPGYASSDAHIRLSLDCVLLEKPSNMSLRDALMSNHVKPIKSSYSSCLDLILSQLVKAVNARDAKLFLKIILKAPLLYLSQVKKY